MVEPLELSVLPPLEAATRRLPLGVALTTEAKRVAARLDRHRARRLLAQVARENECVLHKIRQR